MDITIIIPILVLSVGIYLMVKLRGFYFLHPIRSGKILARALGERESRRSLSLALAGTLGVGNIFGVAAGIIIGGEGSVFWLVISSVFAMVIKYAETLLSFDYMEGNHGGMQYVIRRVFLRHGRPLSLIYGALCLALAFFMGATMQSAAVVDVAASSTNIRPWIAVAVFGVVVFIGVIGGARKIENITEIAIPLTTIIYIISAAAVIFLNISKLNSVIERIVSSAFSPAATGGGVVASLSSLGIREGFARGILSNEAGVGTSAMAHSRAADRPPAVAGLFGMCEVFFDTVILCTLTALAILVSVDNPRAYSTPMSLVSEAFVSSLGDIGGYVLLVCIFVFAYSTVICWYYYGGECRIFLFLGKYQWLFPIIYLIFIILGSVVKGGILLYIIDVILLSMSVLTLSVIVKESDKILKLSISGGVVSKPRQRSRDENSN